MGNEEPVETVVVQRQCVEIHVDETAAFDVWQLIPVIRVLCHQDIHGLGNERGDVHVCRFVWYQNYSRVPELQYDTDPGSTISVLETKPD